METADQKFTWKGSGLIFTSKNSSYGGDVYGIYLISRFLIHMWPANGCYSGQIELQCDNLTGMNDSSEKNMKTRKTKIPRITESYKEDSI